MHIKSQSKKKDVFAIFKSLLYIIAKNEEFQILFDKSCTQENVKYHNSKQRKFTWMNRN